MRRLIDLENAVADVRRRVETEDYVGASAAAMTKAGYYAASVGAEALLVFHYKEDAKHG
jgi:hypothetical protein